ncbi:MAG: hypothetical protein E7254_09220 [Lachnospiraceae bacterium]|nr:hypothetical protein [Lachnospiraceae bacterium]
MEHSEAYHLLVNQLNAVGTERMDGFYPNIIEEVYDWEKNEVEDIIWDNFVYKNEIDLAVFLPKLTKYDGIKALEERVHLSKIPSEASVEISSALYESTGDEKYLDIIKQNIDASPNTISYVSVLSYCKPCEHLFEILSDIYVNNENKVNRNTAVMGMLYNRGIIKDRESIEESNNTIPLRGKFRSDDKQERKRILDKFKKGIEF